MPGVRQHAVTLAQSPEQPQVSASFHAHRRVVPEVPAVVETEVEVEEEADGGRAYRAGEAPETHVVL